MSNKGKYYMTTAIAYTSGKPHIGNTYEIILADAIARYKRSQGYDVFFQTGTDEHGQKIELKAEEAGITPKEFVDNVSGEIKRIWDLMNTSYDKFIRTTDADHEKQVQKIFAIAPKTVNAGPKLFAARIGIVFSAAVVILHLIGLPFSAFTVAGVFAFCAFLEAAFSFCVACRIYPFVYKLNLRFSGQ